MKYLKLLTYGLTIILLAGCASSSNVIKNKKGEVISNGYTKNKDSITYTFAEYKDSTKNSVPKIPNVDLKTFKIINQFYAKDKNKVYFMDTILEGADAKSFKEIDLCDIGCHSHATLNDNYSAIAKDKNYIYIGGKKLEGVKSKEFKHFSNLFFKTKTNVYHINPYNFKVIKLKQNAKEFKAAVSLYSFNSFQYGGLFYRDNEYIYTYNINGRPTGPRGLSGQPLINQYGLLIHAMRIPEEKLLTIVSDQPDNFEFLGWGYSKDDNTLYFRDKKIENSDPDSFYFIRPQKLSDFQIRSIYAKDKDNIYIDGLTIEVCDRKSFKIYKKPSYNWSKDKQCAFYQNHRVPLKDIKSFRPYSGGYSKDKYGVYFIDKELEADPSSFKVINKYKAIAKDKNGCFKDGERKDCETIFNN